MDNLSCLLFLLKIGKWLKTVRFLIFITHRQTHSVVSEIYFDTASIYVTNFSFLLRTLNFSFLETRNYILNKMKFYFIFIQRKIYYYFLIIRDLHQIFIEDKITFKKQIQLNISWYNKTLKFVVI